MQHPERRRIGGGEGIDVNGRRTEPIRLLPAGVVAPAARREHPAALQPLRRTGVVGDASLLVLALVLAEVGAARAGIPPTPALVLVAFAGLVLVLLRLRGMYRRHLHVGILDELRAIAAGTALAAMIVVSLRV